MEIYDTREPFLFSMDVISLKIRCTTVNYWVVTDLKIVLNPSFRTVVVSAVVLPKKSSSVCYLFCSILKNDSQCQKLSAMTYFIPVRHYKINYMSRTSQLTCLAYIHKTHPFTLLHIFVSL